MYNCLCRVLKKSNDFLLTICLVVRTSAQFSKYCVKWYAWTVFVYREREEKEGRRKRQNKREREMKKRLRERERLSVGESCHGNRGITKFGKGGGTQQGAMRLPRIYGYRQPPGPTDKQQSPPPPAAPHVQHTRTQHSQPPRAPLSTWTGEAHVPRSSTDTARASSPLRCVLLKIPRPLLFSYLLVYW